MAPTTSRHDHLTTTPHVSLGRERLQIICRRQEVINHYVKAEKALRSANRTKHPYIFRVNRKSLYALSNILIRNTKLAGLVGQYSGSVHRTVFLA
jgi:hypothetical protein